MCTLLSKKLFTKVIFITFLCSTLRIFSMEQNNQTLNAAYQQKTITELNKNIEEINMKYRKVQNQLSINQTKLSEQQQQIANLLFKNSDLNKNNEKLRQDFNEHKKTVIIPVPDESKQVQDFNALKKNYNNLNNTYQACINNYNNQIKSFKSHNEILITTLLSSWLIFLLYLLRTHFLPALSLL